jgi:hypothetical protein
MPIPDNKPTSSAGDSEEMIRLAVDLESAFERDEANRLPKGSW